MSRMTGIGKRVDWLLLGFVLFVLFFILLFSGRGEGAVLTVDDDPGVGDFSRIQDAIDAAGEGDTIRVFDGKYDESIVIEKSLSIIGNGSESTKTPWEADPFPSPLLSPFLFSLHIYAFLSSHFFSLLSPHVGPVQWECYLSVLQKGVFFHPDGKVHQVVLSSLREGICEQGFPVRIGGKIIGDPMDGQEGEVSGVEGIDPGQIG